MKKFGWLVGRRINANCPLVGPGPLGGLPSDGVFLRDPSPSFEENHGKLRTTRPTSARLNLASPSFEGKTVKQLAGRKDLITKF